MKKTVCPLVLAAVLCMNSNAWSISLTRFLMTAKETPVTRQQEEKIGFLSTSAPERRFLDRMEFRTETDEFRLSQQKYALRLIPKHPGITDAEAGVHEATLASGRAAYEIFLNQELKIRYGLAVALLYNRSLLDINRRMTAVAEDRMHVLRKAMNEPDFQPGDIVRAEEKLTSLELDRLSLEGNLAEIRERMRLYTNDPDVSPEWTPDMLADIGQIEKMLARRQYTAENNIHLKKGRCQTELARQNYALEKSADGIRLGYIEAAWDEGERDSFEKAFSIEIGVEIPLGGAKSDLDRKRQDILSGQVRERETEAELAEKRLSLQHELKRQIARYRLMTSVRKRAGKKKLLRTWSGVEGISPLPLLSIKENILKDEMRQQESLYAIYRNYIEWLDASGVLSSHPLQNHISRSPELME